MHLKVYQINFPSSTHEPQSHSEHMSCDLHNIILAGYRQTKYCDLMVLHPQIGLEHGAHPCSMSYISHIRSLSKVIASSNCSLNTFKVPTLGSNNSFAPKQMTLQNSNFVPKYLSYSFPMHISFFFQYIFLLFQYISIAKIFRGPFLSFSYNIGIRAQSYKVHSGQQGHAVNHYTSIGTNSEGMSLIVMQAQEQAYIILGPVWQYCIFFICKSFPPVISCAQENPQFFLPLENTVSVESLWPPRLLHGRRRY